MSKHQLDYLDELEAEAIYILREVAGQFERPALLFSGGKDSITLVRLAEKAFRPGKFPFPLVHIDTGHNFIETIEYRDAMVKRLGEKLIVGYVQDSIDQGKVVEQRGKNASRNALQTVTLLDTIAEHKFDACIGGARRDEERHALKNVYSPFVMNLASGTLNASAPNCGISITVKYTKAKTLGCSQSVTGRNWMFGTTSVVKKWICRLSTLRINAIALPAMAS